MNNIRPPLEPLHSEYRLRYLSDEQLATLREATLEIMETVGVRFPSQKCLSIFADHGAQVDWQHKIVRLPRDLVQKAMAEVPRYFVMGARDPVLTLTLQDGLTYFTTDGCGVETIDLETRQRRPSCKADVGMMAKVADYLPSIGFYWPMVSAQDYRRAAPLHELDASWNNTVKHVQSETVMGEIPCRYAVEMATVIAGSREELRRRPPFSLVVCTIAPLVQDTAGIEGALVLAEAGVPVGFLAMPTLGTTAPATLAGALAVGDAEVISAAVLMQLHAPGAPVFHSLMQAWADPRSGAYVSYPLDSRCRYAPVEIAHHWGMPSLGACYGTDAHEAGTWQAGGEVALDPYQAGLASPEIVTGMGLSETYTLLYPEQLVMDDDLYQRARYHLLKMDVNEDTLALETVRAVGPGGHFLAQKHTRQHIRDAFVRGITHQIGEDGSYQDPRQVAIEKTKWILQNHHPEPLAAEKQAELGRILAAADAELNQD
ncbi:MAG: trimethylamine methyltransferase family protein [Anaerolineales bacterium]|nr:trimethylamine methyltransferase family protein [Anaerolineales bacterium]